MKVWQCRVCRYIHKGDSPPDKCPICNVPARKFKEIDNNSIVEKRPGKKIVKPVEDKSKISKPSDKKYRGSKRKQDIKHTNTLDLEKSAVENIKSFLIRHHAHPVTVHTPNGIVPAAVIFLILAWLFNYDLFAKVAFINLVFVILTLPVVIFTGILEWKKKYNGAMTPFFQIKIIAAILTFFSCSISIIWFITDSSIITSSNAWLFIMLNIFMLICVGVAGHIGGKLVFKE